MASSSSKSATIALPMASCPLRSRDSYRRTSRPRPSAGPAAPAEVIVLSSDDDDAPAPMPASVRPSQKRRRVSSGCQGKTLPSEASLLTDLRSANDVARLWREVEQLKKENDRLRSCLTKAEDDKTLTRAKCSDLEQTLKRKALSETPELAGLDDTVSCEICTMKMWHPATLVQCGHSFCETCLRDWFNTAYVHHIQHHPRFLTDPEPPVPPQWMYRLNDPQISAIIQHMRTEHYRRVPRPTYTCPTCRAEVRQRPVEVYAVKEFVHKASKLLHDGEEQPPRPSNRAVGSLFDGFFPRK